MIENEKKEKKKKKNKTTQVITANLSISLTRQCKACKRKISVGEQCVRYKKPHRNTYHCLECGKRYNPAVFEEEEQEEREQEQEILPMSK